MNALAWNKSIFVILWINSVKEIKTGNCVGVIPRQNSTINELIKFSEKKGDIIQDVLFIKENCPCQCFQ